MSCLRGGTWGARCQKFNSVRPFVRYAISSYTNQIWCVSNTHINGAYNSILLAPHSGVLGRGQKAKFH